MARFEHIHIKRIEYEKERFKRSFPPELPKRDYVEHGSKIESRVNDSKKLICDQKNNIINPSLILKVKLTTRNFDDDAWKKYNFDILSSDDENSLVLFSSDFELTEFMKKLKLYKSGPKPGKKNSQYNSFFSNLEEVKLLSSSDRIGVLFKKKGYNDKSKFQDDSSYVYDLELWHTGNLQMVRYKVREFEAYIGKNGGKVTDKCINSSVVLMRVHSKGGLIKELLEFSDVFSIDPPPKISLGYKKVKATTLEDLKIKKNITKNSPGIGIIDSGIISGHPLLKNAVGESFSKDPNLSEIDENGHGTLIAGIALYGDLEEPIFLKEFEQQFNIFSSRVLDKNNEINNDLLIVTLIKSSIEYLKKTYDCRIFNLSVGDSTLVYAGGKISSWATLLDSLSRELDVLIVVSAGNIWPEELPKSSLIHRNYPEYLLKDDARIVDPATGALILTVGSLAKKDSISSSVNGTLMKPIAGANQPSPFTRSGLGVNGAIKPEICDYGGNYFFDGSEVHALEESSIVSTNLNYLDNLFDCSVGTSLSTPKICHIAAQILNKFPKISTNFLKCLILASASVPQEARDILEPIDKESVFRLCGYGKPNIEKSLFSNETDVLLYNEDSIKEDNFHMYELPIPEDFISTNGEREISVSLAYNPPVRHTRLKYLGAQLNFRIIRGKSVGAVAHNFVKQIRDVEFNSLNSSKYDCKLEPSSKYRDPGATQKGVFKITNNPTKYGTKYFLVVVCKSNWSPKDYFPQDYAVVVNIKHKLMNTLYSRIEEKVSLRAREKIRIVK